MSNSFLYYSMRLIYSLHERIKPSSTRVLQNSNRNMAATVLTVCQKASDTISIQRHSTSTKGSCTFAKLPNK